MDDPGDPPEPAERPEQEPHRVLRLSRQDRILFGVCGGMARYFGVDPTLVRLAFVVLAVAGGGGILAYVIAVILMPEEQPGEEVAGPAPGDERREGIWFFVGVGLVALGTILLIGQIVPWFDRYVGPLLLIAIGAGVLIHVGRR